jgi:hypothetical protein
MSLLASGSPRGPGLRCRSPPARVESVLWPGSSIRADPRKRTPREPARLTALHRGICRPPGRASGAAGQEGWRSANRLPGRKASGGGPREGSRPGLAETRCPACPKAPAERVAPTRRSRSPASSELLAQRSPPARMRPRGPKGRCSRRRPRVTAGEAAARENRPSAPSPAPPDDASTRTEGAGSMRQVPRMGRRARADFGGGGGAGKDCGINGLGRVGEGGATRIVPGAGRARHLCPLPPLAEGRARVGGRDAGGALAGGSASSDAARHRHPPPLTPPLGQAGGGEWRALRHTRHTAGQDG